MCGLNGILMAMKLWPRRGRLVGVLLGVAVLLGGITLPVFAADAGSDSNFSLQITPSPLVTTVQPGVPSSVELRIRNSGTDTEKLKIEPRSFSLNGDDDSNVKLEDTTPPDIGQWVSFSAPKFSVDPGQWYSEQVKFSLPKDTGFSYSFALIISRQSTPKAISNSRLIQGSVAVFTLVNVNRPGATRKLDVAQLTTDHKVYEFLPTTISVTFKNSGNTIVQPYGNIFIGRGANDKKPLATLPVNDQRSYILPSSSRTITTSWASGFPVYQTTTDPTTGKLSRHLHIDWSKVSNIRIGKYTAHLVAVYDDGSGHDVPIEGDVSFWVIPWRTIILAILVLTGLWFFARWRQKKRTAKAVKRALDAQKAAQKPEEKA